MLNQICPSNRTNIFNSTFLEFEEWKKEELRSSFNQFFVKVTPNKRYIYYCHRSGYHNDIPIVDRKRQLNAKGSAKLDNYCTCHIKLEQDQQTGKYCAKYTKTHYGHETEVCHIRLDESVRLSLASKLETGLPGDVILNQIRADPNSSIIQHLTNKKDLYNISTKFDIRSRVGHRDPSEMISVSMAVDHLKDSVIAFKNQGVTDSDFPLLNADDFFLAYACPDMINQAQEFLNQQNSVIAIDATNGLNTCDFKLIVLMTTDYSRQGYPFSFAISNREDSVLLNYYFRSLSDRYGKLKCDFFMSDDASQYYNSFINVMYPSSSLTDPQISRLDPFDDQFDLDNEPDFFGTVLDCPRDSESDDRNLPHKLLCAYHVEKNLTKNTLNKIKIKDRSTIHEQLFKIRHELNREEFDTKVLDFKAMWTNDYPDFINFLERKYFSRADQWAYCMRKYTGYNCNTFLENFFYQFKEIFFDGKKVRRVDEMFEGAVQFLMQKHARLIKNSLKQKCTPFYTTTFKNHQQSLINYERYQFENQDNKLIISTINSSSKFTVEKTILRTDHKCDLKCRDCDYKCVHSYTCTCEDRAIRSTFCIHIHLAINYYNKSNQIYDDFNDLDNQLPQSAPNDSNQHRPALFLNADYQASSIDPTPELHQLCLKQLKSIQSPIKDPSESKEKAISYLRRIEYQLKTIEKELNEENDVKELDRACEKLKLVESYLKKRKLVIPKFNHQQTFQRKSTHQPRFFSTKKKRATNRTRFYSTDKQKTRTRSTR